MVDSNGYGKYRIPSLSESANLPAAMAMFRSDIDPHTVLFAESSADRNDRYSTCPPGTIVSCVPANSVWIKTGAGNSWKTIWYETDWTEFPSGSFGANFNDVASKWRVRNNMVDLRIECVYDGPSLTTSSPTDANLPDQLVLTLPGAATPDSNMGFSWTIGSVNAGAGLLYMSSGVYLTTYTPGQYVGSGVIRINMVYSRSGN